MNNEYEWLKYRKDWIKRHPPQDGFYMCGICGRWIAADEVTLDHIEPRTASNVYDDDNLQPAHGYCNYKKGSKRWKPKVNKEMYEFLELLSSM